MMQRTVMAATTIRETPWLKSVEITLLNLTNNEQTRSNKGEYQYWYSLTPDIFDISGPQAHKSSRLVLVVGNFSFMDTCSNLCSYICGNSIHHSNSSDL